jgi:Protein of unknown function (DUF3307)
MELKIFLLLIIAHLIADFIFQPQRWSDEKEGRVFSKFHFYHVGLVGLLSYLLALDFGFWKAAILLAVLHLFTDILKSWLILRNSSKNYFFLDQLLHFAAIAAIVIAYSHFSGINFIIDIETKTIATAGGFIFCAKPANVFIKYLFKSFSIEIPQEKEETGLPNAGKLIGIVERYLALTLIIMGQYAAVGLIIAAKSILRFNDTQKSEYVLVGTLLSFCMAVFSGALIHLIK